jgi:hypothetical protein
VKGPPTRYGSAMRELCVLVWLVSLPSFALEPGTELFVRFKPEGVPLFKAPAKGARTLTKLSCGDKVTWTGPAKDQSFQSVTTSDGKKGFVHASDLSEQFIPFSKCGFSKDDHMGSNGSDDAEAKLRQSAMEAMQRALHGGDAGTP